MKLKLTIPHESKIAIFAGAATICMLIQIIGLIWGFMECPNVIRLPFIVIGGLGCFIVDWFLIDYLAYSTFKR